MENIRYLQKKELVFQILDEMKGNGEKINADKVARRAQMGKQTVLPYYNEWRFLAGSVEMEEAEIPNDLIRSLKHLLVHWKHEISGELNSCKNQAKQVSDEHQSIIINLNSEHKSLSNKLSAAMTENEAFTGKIKIFEQQLQKKDLDMKKQYIEDNNNKKIILNLKSQVEDTARKSTLALLAQEKKIDQQYKQQIEHWMKALDEERQKNQAASKQLQLSQLEMLACEREKGVLENQVEHRAQAYLDVCKKKDTLQQQLSDKEEPLILMAKIKLMLDEEEENILVKVKSLLLSERSYKSSIDELASKAHYIQRLEMQLKDDIGLHKQENQTLKLELERSKGYALALKQLTKNTEKK